MFIPLTMLCRDRCGYCTFAKPPARLESPYLELDEILAVARAGRDAGCWEALFTLGESPEERYPSARKWLAAHGYESTVDYLVAAAGAVLAETGLLPHANAGALSRTELERLRAVCPSQGMMLEILAARLAEPGGPHHRAPDKTPERRLATLEAAGEARVPCTTGILVGIGETREERLETLAAIAASHRRHGHVQEVIIQNFLPKPGTGMANAKPCPQDEILWTVSVARLVLDPSVHLQAPPNLASDLAALVAAGTPTSVSRPSALRRGRPGPGAPLVGWRRLRPARPPGPGRAATGRWLGRRGPGRRRARPAGQCRRDRHPARCPGPGLATLPGTAAEILDDEVRAVICPDKVNTEEWLEVHRVAHSIGLRSNVTIMFGYVERPVHWARHLVRARNLQAETGGFTEVVPLPFVHMASPIYLQKRSRRPYLP